MLPMCCQDKRIFENSPEVSYSSAQCNAIDWLYVSESECQNAYLKLRDGSFAENSSLKNHTDGANHGKPSVLHLFIFGHQQQEQLF